MKTPSKGLLKHIQKRFQYNPETGQITGLRSAITCKNQSGNYQLTIKYRGKEYCFTAIKVAWFLHYGEWCNHIIKHINGVLTDDRISNLTIDSVQYHATREKRTSKYRGVCWNTGSSKYCKQHWRAYIYHDKKKIFIGQFYSEYQAAVAYNARARLLFGDNAILNEVII